MRLLPFTLAVFFLVAGCAKQQDADESVKGKVLLAVFAHPDDETTVTPVLSKYASQGADVFLAIATDGRYGVTAHAGIPAGDSLAATRARELNCAAETLGINPPILFGLHDQFKMQGGYDSVHRQLDELRIQVRNLFERLRPDAVITWGPSGWSGHHDHRLVGAVVTEVFESQRWGKPVQLFYPSIPTGKIPTQATGYATTDSSYLDVKITASELDYERARASLQCHQSQYTSEVMEQMRGMISAALGKTTWFRSYQGALQTETLFNR